MLITKIRGKYRFAADSLALAAFLAACPAMYPLFVCCSSVSSAARSPRGKNAAEHETVWSSTWIRTQGSPPATIWNNAPHSHIATLLRMLCVRSSVLLSVHTPHGCAVNLHHCAVKLSSRGDSSSVNWKAECFASRHGYLADFHRTCDPADAGSNEGFGRG